jgi:hypothetical protein
VLVQHTGAFAADLRVRIERPAAALPNRRIVY